MSAPRGLVRVRQDSQGVTVQVVGWGRMQQSVPLRRLGESCLADGSAPFRVDLRHCSYLDSTFLGTLLCLQRMARKLDQGQFQLISPSPECNRLFKQIGVDE
ncbi:MAG: STAS domain-containing protein [Planctomycetes bacterium]|nr:STAS domain-containing protein [Planctomycetota bacterium]